MTKASLLPKKEHLKKTPDWCFGTSGLLGRLETKFPDYWACFRTVRTGWWTGMHIMSITNDYAYDSTYYSYYHTYYHTYNYTYYTYWTYYYTCYCTYAYSYYTLP